MRNPTHPARLLVSALLLLTALAACDTPGAPPAAGEPPNLSDRYNQHEGADLLKGGLESGGVLATIFSSDPRFAAGAALIAGLGSCAQEQGIARWRAYVRKDDPSAAGLVMIVNKTRLTDPQVLLRCIPQGGGDAPGQISPCQKSYTFTSENNEFQVVYAATQESVCTDFCNSLTGCTP